MPIHTFSAGICVIAWRMTSVVYQSGAIGPAVDVE